MKIVQVPIFHHQNVRVPSVIRVVYLAVFLVGFKNENHGIAAEVLIRPRRIFW